MRKSILRSSLFAAGLALAAGSLQAQQQFVYPSEGQSPEQQQKDQLACQQWAQQQTGFNPYQQPAPTAAAPTQSTPSTGQTAGRGAAVGALGGAIGGSAGKGAAIGAGVGAIAGRARRNEAEQQQEAAQAQATQQAQTNRANFEKAFSACMVGRGYTVK